MTASPNAPEPIEGCTAVTAVCEIVGSVSAIPGPQFWMLAAGADGPLPGPMEHAAPCQAVSQVTTARAMGPTSGAVDSSPPEDLSRSSTSRSVGSSASWKPGLRTAGR